MIWLRGLLQDQLDLRLRPSRDLEARIIDRPGAWMAAADIESILFDIRAVAGATLPDGDLRYGVLGGSPERLSASVLTIVYDRATGKPIAFNALAWMPVQVRGRASDIVHLGLVMVDPAARSRGVSWILYGLTCFLLFARAGMRPLWVSNVSQVPAVIGMVCESFADVEPRPEKPQPNFERLMIARRIMRDYRHVFGVGAEATFDETKFVIENAYTGGSDDLKKSFDQAAKHRDERYNAFAERALNYVRGDDFLQLGLVNMAAAQRYAAKEVPPESLPGVLVGACFLFLQALILPALHWFDSKRAWGSLRPWRERTGRRL
jgi:hypothetical protein